MSPARDGGGGRGGEARAPLDEDGAVAERGERLGARALDRLLEVLGALDDAHAAAAAAHRGLDDDGVADRRGAALARPLDPRARLRGRRHGVVGARHERHADARRERARGGLVAEGLQLLDRRPDEGDALGLERGGEVGALREQAVARVHAVDVVVLRDAHDALDIEVRADRRLAAPDAEGLVRLVAVRGVPVLLRVDRNRAQVELGPCAQDASRDLAAVRREQLLERLRPRARRKRARRARRRARELGADREHA